MLFDVFWKQAKSLFDCAMAEWIDGFESNHNSSFVDCGIVWRSSLVWRVIGRMYSLKWGDIVLDSERSGTGSLCVSSVDNHGSEN